MFAKRGRGLLLVPAWRGQQTRAELAGAAEAGERPRSDYVELARALNADIMDMQYMTERATPVARAVARRFGIVPAQVVEAFLRQRGYDHIVARADRLGLPLALLFKVSRGRRNTVLVSAWLSRPKKAVFLSRLKVHSHLRAIINYSSVQMELARTRLGVPAEKLHNCLQPVDEHFWRPLDEPTHDYILSVGWEARDYRTLARAIDGLDVDAVIAVGSAVLRPSGDVDALFGPMVRDTAQASRSARITLRQQVGPEELRRLYAQARFVVVTLHDVDVDAGVTTITEAMAMGKAVIVSRTRGQVDIVRDGENGLYVPPADPAALRAAIARLLNDPDEAERMGKAGRALVEAHHTLDGWVRDVADIATGRRRGRQPTT
ncbi:glycosyltransferase family 4 protein [Planosporangium thailandense]|uniref:Glycosyltransferase family 4 protein n=1 Tax=Planosporangium thailandense TaxID=765197 RepID=A0ABX0Y1D3_9ACTN|nr:glycosyltransferase family 4 protein [Planosporangium thailandense]NJC71277.1 glycosyltransferase family 4 protein [Planosporangium thailandense]